MEVGIGGQGHILAEVAGGFGKGLGCLFLEDLRYNQSYDKDLTPGGFEPKKVKVIDIFPDKKKNSITHGYDLCTDLEGYLLHGYHG